MRAHLARNARRALLQRLRTPSCAVYSAPVHRRPAYAPISRRSCQRTFFDGLFQKAPREVRQPEFEPGWMRIMVWRSRMLDNLRPPPREELIKAWRQFFESKQQSRVPLNGTQAVQCQRLLAYLLQPTEDDFNPPKLKYKDVDGALVALRTLRPRDRTQHHINFAKSLYAALSSGTLSGKGEGRNGRIMLWGRYVKTLALYGGSKEASELLRENWSDVLSLSKENINLVTPVAFGLAEEGLEEDLVELVKHAEANGMQDVRSLQEAITVFFSERGRVAETKQWFQKGPRSKLRSPRVYPAVAELAAQNNLEEWLMPYLQDIVEQKPSKDWWDALLKSYLLLGKGLKEVETLMQQMQHGNKPLKADTTTINGLLRAAAQLKDSLLAEDILALSNENGLGIDGETYLIQMILRLDAGYLPGVQAAYKKVKHLEPWQHNPDLWWEFGQLLNRYIDALTAQKQPDFKLLAELTEAAEEDQIQLEPKTVAALCVRLLENEQHFDVMDILAVHAFQFSAAEREIVQHALTEFCLDPSTSTSRAWTCYQLLRQFFQDLSVERRVQLLGAFFDRRRPDMASHVFGHMRQHRNNDYHPTIEHYIQFFEGLGQNPDEEALEMVYNMMKMDTSIQPNTRLYTSLMLAHTACEKPVQALDFWHEITSSREGPSYASLEAVFWALERKLGGAVMARQVWKRIERMDVDIPPEVYNAYIGAIAGNGDEKETQTLIMRMGPVVGVEPDATTLGIAYNALPGQKLQADLQSWAKMRYPEAWAELEKKGKRMNELSLCQFKLNRVIKA